MSMNEKTIKEALLKGERVTLECKKAKSEVPKELWNTYSAFANTIGGLILLGIEEHRKETGWGEPELKNKIEVDEVELVLPVSATANGIKDSQKSSQKIIELIQENPNVTTSEMAEKIGVTRRAIAKITGALQAEGVIRRVGPDKGGHWEIIK